MLLTGPFGGLTDDVREFLRCLDGDGLLLTGWGELDPASLRTVGSGCRPAAPAATARPAHRGRGRDAAADRAGARVPRPARRRSARLRLRRLVGGGRLGRLGAAARAGAPALARARRPAPGAGRPSPRGQVDLAGFAHRFRVLVGHRWPSVAAAADPGEWRQALWSTALAPLAMLGALDLPERMSPSPAWFAPAGTAPALLAAAAAMSGPEPPAPLASATAN